MTFYFQPVFHVPVGVLSSVLLVLGMSVLPLGLTQQGKKPSQICTVKCLSLELILAAALESITIQS